MAQKTTTVVIEGEMTIANVGLTREQLLEALGSGCSVEVDLSRVNEFDSAGLQLMIAARREATLREVPLHFFGHSSAVRNVLQLCALSDQFDAAAVTAAT
ncbi:lipid asymmetry maintenance protein MlaB [Niveibacterium sp.]|uniref:STAS domain-containing protein n=1 Tax=Niveibacterium sp. TaxID=2017444 RepID=UPI0035AF7B1B